MKVEQVSMEDYTSLRVGGVCEMVRVSSVGELVEVVAASEARRQRLHILGLGTNSYFANDIRDLLVIKIEIKGIEVVPHQTVQGWGEECVIIKAFAGETWDDVVKFAVERGWWGVENLSWVAGSTGAGPVQNIGAYGTDISDSLINVEVLNRQNNRIEILNNKDCEFGYRDSIFKRNSNKYIIISITLKLSKLYKPTLTYAPLNRLDQNQIYTPKQIREIIIDIRKSKIPDYNILPNAGSFFKNPLINKSLADKLKEKYKDLPLFESGDSEGNYKVSAAWLIEHIAMMKGVRVGDVGTYDKQALILINHGHASASDISDFSQKVIDIIEKETGISLEREVNHIS